MTALLGFGLPFVLGLLLVGHRLWRRLWRRLFPLPVKKRFYRASDVVIRIDGVEHSLNCRKDGGASRISERG